MNSDEIAILYFLYATDEPVTTTTVAKNVFEPKGTQEVRNQDRRVRHYLDKHSHLVEIQKRGGKKFFSLKQDSVIFGVGVLEITSPKMEEASLGLGRVMLHFDSEGYPCISTLRTDGEDGSGEYRNPDS